MKYNKTWPLVVLAFLVFPLATTSVVFIVMHCWTSFCISEAVSNFNCIYVCMYEP